MADRLHPMLLVAVACCALSGCATQTPAEPEEPVAAAGEAATAASTTPPTEVEPDPPVLAETPPPPRPLEGLRLPPTEVALPKDDQFRATNPGGSRFETAPRPDPGPVIVRPSAE
jgi:hypothetical protein